MDILNFNDYNESLLNDKTLNQLKKVRELSKGIDIGDRISDMNKEGANIIAIKNPIDGTIETREDFDKKNDKFKPCRNTDVGGGICQ
jgi:hypothetical protein